MPNLTRQPLWRPRPRALVCLVSILVVLMLSANLHLALKHQITIPLVDGWPVLRRIMLLEQGQVSWDHYLLGLHGAHMHALIYLITLLDFRWFGGQQQLQSIASLGAVAVFTLFIVGLMTREGIRQGHNAVGIVLTGLATVALLSGMSDTESMLIPFQAVLTVSRLFYIGLLYGLCVAILRDRPVLYAVVMLASLPAVAFHGTGHLFALCVILIHLLLRQRLFRLAISCLPLICAVVLQSLYSEGGGELSNLGQVFTPSALVQVPAAIAAYFATPFVAYLHIVDNRWLLIPGGLLACSTAILTLMGIREVLGFRGWAPSAWWRQYRHPADSLPRIDPGTVLFTIVGILLLLSGLAAAVFWFIRGAGDTQQPWQRVFDGTRYGAYSALACLMLLAACLHRSQRAAPSAIHRSFLPVCAAVLLALGLGGSLRMSYIYHQDDRTNRAMAGISLGLSPILPQTNAIWPSVAEDWFWRDELPRVVTWLRQAHMGPWHDLPALHTRGGPAFATYPLNDVRWDPMPVDTAPGWCQLTAALPVMGRSLPSRSTLMPVATADGIVSGYAVMTQASAGQTSRVMEGFAGCALGNAPLFVPRIETP